MSVDSWAAGNAFAESLGAGFPLLGDWPYYEVARAYGVYNEQTHTARRVTFVIGGDGVIRAVIDEAGDMSRHAAEALAVLGTLTPLPATPPSDTTSPQGEEHGL